MKTTLELADDLVLEARQYAARRGTTLRAVIEQGIRTMLSADRSARIPFALRDASVDGSGLQAGFRDEDRATIRKAAYEGRGE